MKELIKCFPKAVYNIKIHVKAFKPELDTGGSPKTGHGLIPKIGDIGCIRARGLWISEETYPGKP